MADKRTKAITIPIYPWRGSLRTAGRKSSIPEDSLWRAQNFTTKLDGLLEKRPGLKKWGQTIKTFDADATGSTVTSFSDFLTGTGGFVATDNGNGFVEDPTTDDGYMQTNVLVDDGLGGNDNYVMAYATSTTPTGSEWSLRFMFKGTNLPAYTPAGTDPNTFSFRGIGAAGSGKEFAIWSGGLYYKKDSDDTYELITGTEYAGAGGWNAIEVNVDDAAGSTTVYFNDTLVATLTSSDLKDAAPTGTSMYHFRWEVEGSGTAGTQYTTRLATPMYNDTVSTPFKTVEVKSLFDYQYASNAGSTKRSLLLAAGNYIYHDNGLAGAWRPLKPKQYQEVYFTTFRRSVIWFDHSQGNFSNVWKWDGQGSTPELLDDAPVLHAGGEHQQRLFAFGPEHPLRLYYSGDRQENVWFSPAADNIEDEFSTLLNAGYLTIPSREKGDRITAFRGGYFGIAIVCTRHGAYRVLGAGINSYRIEKVGSSDAAGAENAHCITDIGNDLATLSRKGIHLLSATEQYGDIKGTFLSAEIQDLWGEDPTSVDTISREFLDRARLKYSPQQGLLYCAVPLTGDTHAVRIFVYNVNTQQWTGDWSIDSRAMENVEIATPEIEVMMHAGEDGQVGYTDQSWKTDFGSDGYEAILESAFIDGRSLDPRLAGYEKTWKRLRIYVLPRGNWDIDISWYVDDKDAKTETKSQNVRKFHVLTEDWKIGANPDGKLRSREQIVPIEIRLDTRGKSLTFIITSPDNRGEDLVIQGIEIDAIPLRYEEEA